MKNKKNYTRSEKEAIEITANQCISSLYACFHLIPESLHDRTWEMVVWMLKKRGLLKEGA